MKREVFIFWPIVIVVIVVHPMPLMGRSAIFCQLPQQMPFFTIWIEHLFDVAVLFPFSDPFVIL